MNGIQGEFRDEAAARRATAALKAAGVRDERVRVWNILPDEGGRRGQDEAAANAAARGALIGGVLGGVAGSVIGGALGAARAGDDAHAGPGLPAPAGVRVVVDATAAGPDIAALLEAAGAVNVRAIG
jgi:hypothetical protein